MNYINGNKDSYILVDVIYIKMHNNTQVLTNMGRNMIDSQVLSHYQRLEMISGRI